KNLNARPTPTPQLNADLLSLNKLTGALPEKSLTAQFQEDSGEGGGAGGFAPMGSEPGSLSAKAQQTAEMTHKVEGNLSATIDVTAPRGTRAKASGDQMFRQVNLNRTMASEPSRATNEPVSDGAAEE